MSDFVWACSGFERLSRVAVYGAFRTGRRSRRELDQMARRLAERPRIPDPALQCRGIELVTVDHGQDHAAHQARQHEDANEVVIVHWPSPIRAG